MTTCKEDSVWKHKHTLEARSLRVVSIMGCKATISSVTVVLSLELNADEEFVSVMAALMSFLTVVTSLSNGRALIRDPSQPLMSESSCLTSVVIVVISVATERFAMGLALTRPSPRKRMVTSLPAIVRFV